MFFTPQVHGAKVESVKGDEAAGVRIIFPNTARLVAGSRVELMTYEAGYKGWHVYGQGTVTPDGRQIVPDRDVVIKQFMCLHIVGPESDAPPEGPPPCDCSAYDGDPVHLGTGLFVMNQTDLVLPDTIPIAVTRTYRQRDTKSRSFGIGATHPYQMILVGPGSPYSQIDLLLPDGGKVRFNRISAGTGYTDAVLEHTSTPSLFYKATLRWDAVLFGWEMKFRDGRVWQFKAFGNNQGPPTLGGMIDRNGNKLTISHTTGRKIDRITTPNQRWMEFSYDTSNRITEVRDNIGRVVNYQYDTSGRLWKVTDPVGGVSEYTYDTSHRMKTIKDAREIVHVTVDYDANGRVMKETLADGGVYEFDYTLDGNGKVTQTEVTDPRGQVRRVTFNSDGYSLTDTHAIGTPLQQTMSYGRETATNFVPGKTDPLGRATQFGYDSMGNLTSMTDLAGTSEAETTTYTYETNFNQVASITDPLGRTTSYEYDSKGNLIRITDPLNNQTVCAYNSAGQVVSVTNPLSQTTQYVYEQGDLVRIIDPMGNSVSWFTDAAGRVLSLTNALGQTGRFEYDALNRVTKVIDPIEGMTTFTYDANGNRLSLTDARNNVTSYSYDDMDRMITRTDALSRVESFEYDLMGNLTKFTDRRGKVKVINYDGLNRRIFEGFGAMTSGEMTTYESTISYSYDGTLSCGCSGTGGRLAQVTDSVSGTITYAYDDHDRVTSETTAQGTVSYTYNAVGRRATMSVSGQSTISYTYDNADRLTQISQGSSTVTFGYDAASRRTSLTQPNGVVTEYGYDAASRLTGITYKKGANVLGSLSYEYDAAGKRTKMGGSYARMNLPPAVTTASYDSANQQTGFANQTLSYDANGNMTGDGTNTYTWNARNQLVGMIGSGLNASFEYDGLGRRISKTINSVTTSYLYDKRNLVQEQMGGGASANLLTGLGIDEVFARTESSATTSLLRDGLGSVIALTDSAGAVQSEYSYEPFGKTATSGAASSNPSKYTGREDDGTGLYYYRARYYSPSLQRFISEDPAGFADGYNPYEYVRNSPVNLTDPSGEFASMLPGTWPIPGIPPFPRIPWPWLVGAAVVIVVVIAIIYVCDVPIPIRIPRVIPEPRAVPPDKCRDRANQCFRWALTGDTQEERARRGEECAVAFLRCINGFPGQFWPDEEMPGIH